MGAGERGCAHCPHTDRQHAEDGSCRAEGCRCLSYLFDGRHYFDLTEDDVVTDCGTCGAGVGHQGDCPRGRG